MYETFLQPTDDVRSYPYLTYDNVLVWKGFVRCPLCIPKHTAALPGEAEKVRLSILEHCVVQGQHGPYYAWSTDLKGHTDVYDEPPGSLLPPALLGLLHAG